MASIIEKNLMLEVSRATGWGQREERNNIEAKYWSYRLG
jgi:hypothetical protein